MSDDVLRDEEYQRQAEFRYAIRRFSRFSEDQARLAGITPQQHLLLLTIRGHHNYPNVSIKDVAERLQIRHHSASLLVDRSINRRSPLPERAPLPPLLVKSEDAYDKRKALVSLTPEGQGILDHITRANRRELWALDEALFGFRDSLVRALGAGTSVMKDSGDRQPPTPAPRAGRAARRPPGE